MLIQHELRGRAIVIRDSRRKFTRDDLEFLLVLVGQAAASLETVRLQAKAEEVAVLEERARIARDLHDGFIQALAGIDLRVEAAKLLLQRDPARVPKALEDLHAAVDSGYREVRHYLTVLRQASRQDADLGSTLDRLAAEFSIRERLKVHMARPQADPGLPTSTAYELTQIVREALHNAVRHGQATQAVVKLGARPSHVYLVIRDNGRGFPNGDGSVDARRLLEAGRRTVVDPRADRGAGRIAAGVEQARAGRRGLAADSGGRCTVPVDSACGGGIADERGTAQAPHRDRGRPHPVP